MSPAKKAALGVGLLFSSNGLVFASLLPWYPQLKAALGLSATQFGIIVAMGAVGALTASALPPHVLKLFGPRMSSLVSTALMCFLLACIPWVPNGFLFGLILFLTGAADSVADVSQNVSGVRVQTAARRNILSSMHALWSLGAAAGGALGTAGAAAGMSFKIFVAIMAVVGMCLVFAGNTLIGSLADAPAPDDSAAPAPRPALRVLLLAVAPLAALSVAGAVVEDLANNWGALAGVQLAGMSAGTAGLVVTAVIASQSIGRFTGDPLTGRFGARAVARVGSGLILFGGLLVLFSHGAPLLFLGFCLAGFGTATLIPGAFAAAAHIPGVSEGAGVTMISWVLRLGGLLTSPIVGVVTDNAGLRWGMAALVVSGCVALITSRALPARS
ncbi:MFS transporter [uncultured Corynebacterium sp.]|uniref:MFS transporter n=1 Tax=uncultured Corynebacterium sp. TaxID=159447 RepID=UPI0026005A2B|nr:MFS transporter [uncultured Corynebacterium sp.]